jgi:hypothetical protein
MILLIKISILSLLFSNAVTLRRDLSILLTIIAIILIMSYYNNILYFIIEYLVNLFIINNGLSLHGGLLHITNIIQIFHIFIYLISILILQLTSFYPVIIRTLKSFFFKDLKKLFSKFYSNKLGEHLKIIEYPLMILFVIAGAVFLISTNDLISIFLFIKLQSYGLYLLSISLLYTNIGKIRGLALSKYLIIFFVNIFNNNGFFFTKMDSKLNLFVIYIYIYTKNINCFLYFSCFFLFLLLYKAKVLNMWNIAISMGTDTGTIYLIYLNLFLLLFLIGFMISLVRLIVKLNFVFELKLNYPLSFNIIKYLLLGLLLLNIIIIIVLGLKILILFKVNLMNKLKDWKLNIDYELRKGNKWPKNSESFKIFSLKKKKEKRKAAETVINLKERIFEIQKNKDTINPDFNLKSASISLSKNRNWTGIIEIPKGSDFTIESQIKNIEYEYQAYFNQEKKFKKIVIDINDNKENFYPKESKSLFNEYVKVIKLLKSNLKDVKKELIKLSK